MNVMVWMLLVIMFLLTCALFVAVVGTIGYLLVRTGVFLWELAKEKWS